jgi:hypothetical protein
MNDEESRIGVSRDRVAERAYELYCEGGCEDGHDLEHWLQAEAELAQAVAMRNEPEAAETGASA